MSHNFKNNSNAKYQLLDETYQILATLGRGQNSVVYKARNISETDQEKSVALKVVFKDAHPKEAFQRLKREALSLLATRHNNVVRMIDYKTVGDYCYLVLDYAEHGTLEQLLERSPAGLPWQQAINVMKQVLSGLASVHRAGIIHRDIKPDNLLLTAHGTVKIADFSLACFPHEEEQIASEARGIGTLEYLAPETLKDSISNVGTDVYAAGVTFFRLLTGQFPFPNESLASHARAKIAGHRYTLSHFIDIPSAGFETLINQALAEHSQARYQSAEQFLSELEKLEKMLFGKNEGEESTVPARRVVGPLIASDENRFREQHELFSNFRNEIESGDTSLVSVEASHAGPIGSAIQTGHKIFESYLSSTPRRIFFMALLLLVFFGVYKVVSLNSVIPATDNSAVSSLWLTKPDRVLQAFQPYLEDEIHLGVIRGLNSTDRDEPLYFRQAEDGKYRFGISVAGWEDAIYSYQDLAEARELQLVGESGKMTFRIEGKTNYPVTIWGSYYINDSEPLGRWIIW